MSSTLNIAVACRHYLPGWKGGGPVRSLSNLVNTLGKEFTFWIITSDRDLGDKTPYEGIKSNQWHSVGNANVIYMSMGSSSWLGWRKLLHEVQPDLLYLNSFFSPQ